MLGEHDSIAISPSSAYAKEMAKWETTHTKYGPPGRKYTFQEYPKMLYKLKRGNGLEIEATYTVQDADEERNLNSRGFLPLEEAAKAMAQEQTEHGKLAAEREYEIQHGRLSEKAISEVRAAEEAHGSTHMPVVPETPIPTHRKRGRKPKAAA